MHRVLVAVDVHEEAPAGTRLAMQMGESSAAYRVVHARKPALPPDEAVALLWRRAAGLPDAEPKLLEGEPAHAILREARDWRASVIVLSPHRHSRLEEFLLGSTSLKVLRQAPASVLLARPATAGLERVLVCTDLHRPSQAAARLAARLASRTKANLTVLFAAHPGHWGPSATAPWPPDALDVDADWLSRAQQEAIYAWLRGKVHEFNAAHFGGAAQEIVREGVPEDVILEETRTGAYDLVVLGTHGPTRYERATIGNVAETVATRAPTSVLVVKGEPERI